MSSVALLRARALASELRFDRHELSGAFGDSGVLFPLAASLIAINGLNPTVVFAGAGLFYVAAALYFRLPMPVQPLKAFSAIAIAFALTPSVIAAGALILGAAFLVLGATGLIRVVGRVVPIGVVKGIQLALGIALLRSAWDLSQRSQGLAAVPAAVGAFGVSSVRRKTDRREYPGAADSFLLWNKAGGRVLRGLTLRRQAERLRYLLNETH